MKNEVKTQTIKQKTGRPLSEWIAIIEQHKIGEKSHRDIAAYLNEKHGVSPWWAQTLTVLYEKKTKKRVTGQTKKNGFQIGVSKTFHVSVEELWDSLIKKRGLKDITAGCREHEITTFREYSHLRMRWKKAVWPSYSILQVRLTGKKSGKTTLTFHQEKLAGPDVRAEMKAHWQEVATKIDKFIQAL